MKKTTIKNPFLSFSNIFKKKDIIENRYDIENKPADTIVGYQCKECLKQKGFSQICLDNFTNNCQEQAIKYCNECGKYCSNLCDEDAGGGLTNIYKSNNDIEIVNARTNNTSGSQPQQDDEVQDPPPIDNCTDDYCKQTLYWPRGVPGTDPFYVMYRHTGCHLIWYPPEFAFGNNPTISQCKGFKVRNEFDGGVASCHPEYVNFAPVGAAAGLYDPACVNPDDYGRGSWPIWPCYCRAVPHIRDGIYGTLYRKPNINQSPGQFGYISYMDPFTDGMELKEADCCYCASTRLGAFTSNGAPLWPQRALSWRGWFAGGAAGELCTPGSNVIQPFVNVNYKESCYEYGISPYLKKISKNDYKIGFDIWTYGGPLNSKQDLGPAYDPISFSKIGYWFDYDINFTDVTTESKLQDVLVGFVGLEHHFESYAYKSNQLSAPTLNATQNHGNVLKGPFERGYGGTIDTTSGCGNFVSDVDSSLKWQLYRKTPRRFMYGGAKVPLFHFDLYYFELLSKQRDILINGKLFDAKRFLKGYYNYFYTVLKGEYVYIDPCNGGMKTGQLDYEPIHLFDTIREDYEYVTASLKEMIRYNVISIKDHAPDIANEINDIIASAKYVTNPTTGNQELELNPYVDGIVGGVDGYMDLVNFFGVAPITGKVTVTQVKQFLIDPEVSSTGGEVAVDCAGVQLPGAQSYFRFPRRTFLPPYPKSGDLVAWGCETPVDENGNPINVNPCSYGTPSANVTYDQYTEWTKGRYINVYSGMHTNYWLIQSGQILGSGYPIIPPGSISVPPSEEAVRQAARDGQPYGKVSKVSTKSTNLAIALVQFPNGNNLIDPEGVSDSCEISNGGDSPLLSGQNYTPSPYYRIIAWGSNKCNGVFIGGVNSISNNKSEQWVDAASGFNHVVAIGKGNFGSSEYDNDRLFFVGDNNYGQAPELIGDLTGYGPMAKPGYFTDDEWQGILNGSFSLICFPSTAPTGDPNSDYRCALFQSLEYNTLDRPVWTKVAAGQYHSVAVQSDNQVKIWGKYFRIDKDGNRDTDVVTNTQVPIVDTFIPDEIKDLAAKWTLTFGNNSNGQYVCTDATVTPNTAQIKFIDSGPDYTMMVVGNTLYVWGRVEMLPSMIPSKVEDDPEYLRLKETGVYSTTIPGEVINISAGANSWIVNYKVEDNQIPSSSLITSFPTNKTIQWIRKHVYDVNNKNYYNYGLVPTANEDKSAYGYKSIASGFGHVAAISYGELVFPKWDYDLFESDETRKNQFSPQNGKALPTYFKSFAFFRGLPGGWDFSKWFYGKFCGEGLDSLRAPGGITTCEMSDPCSILGEPDPTDETGLRKDQWSYSGNPQYWWMQKSARRYQHANGFYQSPVSNCLRNPKPKAFCGAAAQTQFDDTGVASLTTCQTDYDLCWQVDSNPIFKVPSDYYPGADGRTDCVIDCDDTETGRRAVRKPINGSFIAKVCTEATGRAAFRSTKDYFLQSYKIFGLKDFCCSVVATYLSYATYATRNTAFALNESTNIWEIKTNPDPYRTGFASNTLKAAADGVRLSNKNIKYPLIYVGGITLRRLENSFYNAYYGADDGSNIGGCNPDDGGKCPYNPDSAFQEILGPGGWLWGMINNQAPNYDPLSNSVFKQTYFLYDKDAQLKTPYNIIGYDNFGYESGSTFTFCYETPLTPSTTPVGSTGWAFDNYCGLSYYIGQDFNDTGATKTLTCEIKKLVVFDPSDERNYASPTQMTLKTKWHKMNYDPILVFPGGLTGFVGQFAGGLEEQNCTTTDSLFVSNFQYSEKNGASATIYTGTITCPDQCIGCVETSG